MSEAVAEAIRAAPLPSAATGPESAALAPAQDRAPAAASAHDYLELAKPRITALVLVTTGAGFYLGSAGGLELALLLNTLLGTALVAGGTSAMNQVLERDVDALMRRTRARPVPAGRIAAGRAGLFAGALSVVGVAYLALAVNLLTAALAAIAFVVYDLMYTPLKRVHSLSTLVGAVPGALPIVGGWTAATGNLGVGAWALFGLLFFWQLPHFLALAWLLRDDYGAAGLRMLSVGDPAGRSTRHQTILYTLALVPISLLPSVVGIAGAWYFGIALALGLGFLLYAGVFSRDASGRSAGRLFRYSILYLPALLLVLVADKL